MLDIKSLFIFLGARTQPQVHFQRRSVKLPENTSYSDLTAYLTAASSPWEVDSFPYLQGLDGNGTGNPLLWFCSDFILIQGLTFDPIIFSIPHSSKDSFRFEWLDIFNCPTNMLFQWARGQGLLSLTWGYWITKMKTPWPWEIRQVGRTFISELSLQIRCMCT